MLQPRLLRWRVSSVDEKNDMATTHGNIFLRMKFFRGQVSCATSNPWTVNLAFEIFQLEASFFSKQVNKIALVFSISSIIPAVASNSIVLS